MVGISARPGEGGKQDAVHGVALLGEPLSWGTPSTACPGIPRGLFQLGSHSPFRSTHQTHSFKANVQPIIVCPFLSSPEASSHFISQATHQVRKEAGIKTLRIS